MWDKSYNEKLNEYKAKSIAGGGAARIEKQHSQGKLTARERLEILFDKGTFREIGALRVSTSLDLPESKRIFGDGVVTGYGKVNGKTVYVASQDFTVSGGSLGSAHAKKICQAMDLALESMAPFVCINDGGGARIEEGVNSLDGYSGIFTRNTLASGIIPQISVILGPCAGGACYSPAITDFIFMTEKTSQMFITGPGVVKAVTAETVSPEGLGGAGVHSTKSGVSHFVCKDDKETLEAVRNLLSYLPQSNLEKPPVAEKFKAVDKSKDIEEIVPDNFKKGYDVRNVIETFADKDSFLEIQKDFARNVVIGFARMDGNVVGIVANQPNFIAGSLDVDASDKASRFVRFCDCFNIPILTLEDVPGYMPGTKAFVRLRRSDRAEGDAYPPQGLRWRLHRHEQQEPRCRLRVRAADRPARRDGSRRCRRHPSPQGNRRVSHSCRNAPAAHRRIRREVPQPVYRRQERLYRRSHLSGPRA